MKTDTGWHVDLTTSSGRTPYHELFKENGIHGVLEVQEVDCIDGISLFKGVIVDRFCGEESDAPLTEMFSTYADIVCELYQRNGHIW